MNSICTEYVLGLAFPALFACGWFTARWGGVRRARVGELSSDYFRGLNYLLNEEQDKAIEVFSRLIEHDRDSVEMQLALGTLFRRRGEVDRAIRLHQHLVSRAQLPVQMKTLALLELGEDYMRAGLLDRAEALFSDLVAMENHTSTVLRQLVSIYQQERDWDQAINYMQRLEATTGEDTSATVAQFYCEQAQQAAQYGDRAKQRACLEKAFQCQRECARAWLITGQLYREENRLEEAIEAYGCAVHADIHLVPEVLPLLLDVYTRPGLMQPVERFLGDVLERYEGISPVLALTQLYRQRDGEKVAIDFLTTELRRRPSARGLIALVDATADKIQGEVGEHCLILRKLTEKLLEGQMSYHCIHCGFSARSHHWQCPSCRSWSTIRPIYGVAGE